MRIISTIEFKSTEDNYRKEASGEKSNTVRYLSSDEEKEVMDSCPNIKYIRIKCVDGNQSFVRELTDITMFELMGIKTYIFSW